MVEIEFVYLMRSSFKEFQFSLNFYFIFQSENKYKQDVHTDNLKQAAHDVRTENEERWSAVQAQARLQLRS